MKIVFLLLLFNSYLFNLSLAQQPNFKVKWGEVYTHLDFINYGVSNLIYYKNGIYFEYETIVKISSSKIKNNYPKISFFKLNVDYLRLDQVNDKELINELFDLNKITNKYNSTFNEKWIYDPYDLTPKKNIEEHTVELFCLLDDQKYADTIRFMRREGDFLEHISDFLVDDSKLKGVYYVDCGVEDVFMKLYFIEFNMISKKLSIIKKDITYENIGFKKDKIKFIRTFSERSYYNGEYEITLFFNVDNSKKIGLVNINFDFDSSAYNIKSIELEDSTLLPEFNDLDIFVKRYKGELHYFIATNRWEITNYKGLKNTQLGAEKGVNLLHLKQSNNEFTFKSYIGAENNLEHILMDDNRLVLIYNGKTDFENYTFKFDNSGDNIIKYSVVDIKNDTTTVYIETLIKNSDWIEELDWTSFHMAENANLSNEISIYVNYFHDWPQTKLDKQYRMGIISFKLP